MNWLEINPERRDPRQMMNPLTNKCKNVKPTRVVRPYLPMLKVAYEMN